ncbi:c-type cytochrome [Nonlabens sp. SY33080]|uniref:c-type cytochrome n=1 Tax=unclassified Nonlabens TaxID=2615035 RepID=UPI001428B83C|nr:cytochrome c [Nonlabens sp. SY33080]
MKNILACLFTALILCSCGTDKEKKQTIKLKEPTKKELTAIEKSAQRGKEIYRELCVTCHLTNGKGVTGAFPPLNPSDWITGKRKESIHAVKYGLKGEIVVNGVTYNNIMQYQGLDDEEVADVLNYIIDTWNPTEKMVTVEEVQQIKK